MKRRLITAALFTALYLGGIAAFVYTLNDSKAHAQPALASVEHLWGYRITKAGTQQVILERGQLNTIGDAEWLGQQAALTIEAPGQYEISIFVDVTPQ